MSQPLTPLADRVIATREEAATRTASGLYLPDSAKEKPSEGKVLAVGKDVEEVASVTQVAVETKEGRGTEAGGEEITGAFPADREAVPATVAEGNVVDDLVKDAQDVHREEREHLCSFT